MVQILNILFHFNEIFKIDDQEAKTKNKEINFIFECYKDIVGVRKGREANEYKAELASIIKENLGYHEIDYLEIFIWKKKDYNSVNAKPYKTFLIKIVNVNFDSFVYNNNTIVMKFIQDQIHLPINVFARDLIRDEKKPLVLEKEKNILRFEKKEIIAQKSIDLLHILGFKF